MGLQSMALLWGWLLPATASWAPLAPAADMPYCIYWLWFKVMMIDAFSDTFRQSVKSAGGKVDSSFTSFVQNT